MKNKPCGRKRTLWMKDDGGKKDAAEKKDAVEEERNCWEENTLPDGEITLRMKNSAAR